MIYSKNYIFYNLFDGEQYLGYNKVNMMKGGDASMSEKETKKYYLKKEGCLNKNAAGIKAELFNSASNFFDKNDVVQARYEMLRCVEKDGYAINTASELFGVSRISFYKTKKAFDKKGIYGLLPVKKGPKGPYKLTAEVIFFIEAEKKANADIPADELADKVREKFNVKIHPRTIEKALVVSKKKPTN